MPVVKGPTGDIYYQDQGQGEPLVMLRGLGRSMRYWLDYDAYLSRHFRVITLDYRGIGRSSAAMGWTDRIEDLAADVKAVLDAVKINSAHFFGLSLGGMVAMAMAAEYPDYCRRLIVANSSTADSGRFRIQPMALKDLIAGSLQGQLQMTLMELLTTPRLSQRFGFEILKRWQAIHDEEGFPATTVTKQLLAAARFKIAGRVNSFQTPTLVLYGNQDRFVPKGNSKRLAKLLGACQVKIVRGVGHEITIGQEGLLSKLIINYLLQPKESLEHHHKLSASSLSGDCVS